MSSKSIEELIKDFNYCVERVKKLKKKPTDDEKLKLYGYYKQVNFGDINIEKPSIFNFTDYSKWNAWNKCKNITKEKAVELYIVLVYNLIKKYDEN